MTTKEIMLLAKNRKAVEMLNELAKLSETNENGRNKKQIEILSIKIHNEIVTDKMILESF